MAANGQPIIEVLPPEATALHPFNRPVQFSMQNTLQSPLFWLLLGAGGMWALHYYFTQEKRTRREA